jgi:hypothetical protein
LPCHSVPYEAWHNPPQTCSRRPSPLTAARLSLQPMITIVS